MRIMILVSIGVLAVFFAVFIPYLNKLKRKREQLRRYTHICLGMSEDEMLRIMGAGYNRSLLKDGSTRYEWRINGSSYGTVNDGFIAMSNSAEQKVDITCRDGSVEEVIPYNVT